MPVKNELAQRRYEKLVDHLESLMRAALKPAYQGDYGQLILSVDDLAKMGELKDVGVPLGRRDGVSAGRRPPISSVAGSSYSTGGRCPRRSSNWLGMPPLLRLTGPGRKATARAG